MTLSQITPSTNILILGFAREGQSTYRFLRSRFPDMVLHLADAQTPNGIPSDPRITTHFGPDYLDALKLPGLDLVIKSPGVSPHKPEIIATRQQGLPFTSHTRIFFEICPSKNTIGVSGTKGKSTTTSLIYDIFQKTGLDAVLVGNIGKPALDFLPDIHPGTWVICELSSYQLMDLDISPHIAVLQNIFPDHLDYHESFEEYLEAKTNIARYQTPDDFIIYNNDFPLPAQISEYTPARKFPFSLLDFDPHIHSRLLGNHNKYNILPAVIISQILDLPKSRVYQIIAEFKPLDTRLQEVASVNGVVFFEDTLATIPEATIAAIDALHPRVQTLIAGGHERKQNYSNLARKILDSRIKTLIVFPDTGPRIWHDITTIEKNPNIKYYYVDSMSKAVKIALDQTTSGGICLLSPAAPSFTLFKDYRDEGDQYRQAINSHQK